MGRFCSSARFSQYRRVARRALATVIVALGLQALLARAIADEPTAQIPPAAPPSSTEAAPRDGIAGDWQGTLAAGVKLRVVFHIAAGKDGAWTAKLDSPDQGAIGIPIGETTFVDGTVRMTAKSIGGSFEGKYDSAAGTIAGEWKQGGASLPLVLKPAEKLTTVKRPQVPQKPYPYDEVEVTYKNDKADVTLAGTLTLPKESRPSAAVLLITGSGAQDRDESLLGHKPFLILADYLARHGIAALRVDDRGVGGSSGSVAQSTTRDFADDVLAGVAYLKSRPEIDPQRIGLIGHSEGGLVAPLAATMSPDVAFIVMLAGPGVTGEEILYAQGKLILKAAGADDKAVAAQRRIQETLFTFVREFERRAAATADKINLESEQKKLVDLIMAATKDQPEEQQESVGRVAAAQSQELLTPWFRFFLTYDPRPVLKRVQCPVLAVIGERDLQVPAAENLAALKEAFAAGGNSRVTLRELPGLNHLLQKCTTGSPTEYAAIEETMNADALALVADWITNLPRR